MNDEKMREHGEQTRADERATVVWPEGLEVGKNYEVRSDMYPGRKLIGHLQEDGDVCLAIVDESGHMVEVEYCTPSMGGGRFPLVHAAARELVKAIFLEAAGGAR